MHESGDLPDEVKLYLPRELGRWNDGNLLPFSIVSFGSLSTGVGLLIFAVFIERGCKKGAGPLCVEDGECEKVRPKVGRSGGHEHP